MKKRDMPENDYQAFLHKAIAYLQNKDFSNAQAAIIQAMSLNMDAAAPHNLLGVMKELKGDENCAQRHYRAAYALEPGFKPACRNLQRMADFTWGLRSNDYDYGLTEDARPTNSDIIRSIFE